jgi:solute carrier family 6 GABA transporter-like protein 1
MGTPGEIEPLTQTNKATLAKTAPTVEKKEEEENERGTWNSQWDFAMSCIAYAIGLGNVWRFPYLCFKNGGGAFLIPYFFSMVVCGIPLFFLEVSVGQYLGVGGMSVVGQLAPILKGVGYSAMTMVFLENCYYIIVVTWTLFYLFNTFMDLPSLPWSHCSKGNGSWANEKCWNPDNGIPFNQSTPFKHGFTEAESETAVEQFWNNEALNISEGIEEAGMIQWDLFGCLLFAWLVVYGVIWKGLHNSGKILWFSAIFPYVVLAILCVKALTLEGATDGLAYLYTPQWHRLLEAEVWIDGGTQIFFSYGVGIGALLALGSYNKFHHNCHRDAIMVCCINTFTSFFSATVIFSILGYMAHTKGVDVGDVVKSGPGLAFLVYPEVVLTIAPSPLWACLFFVMLLTLGIDSQFCGVEALITGLVDNWPELLRPHRKKFTLLMTIFMCLLGLPMITRGGVYVFQLMDFYAASGMSLLWCVFFQTIAICWVFGAKKFYNCIEEMIGYKVNWYWYICWVFLSPAFMVFVFGFYFIKYSPIKYGNDYEYPAWGEALGFLISLSSMIWVPGYAIYFMLTTPGTWREVLRIGTTAVIIPRTGASSAERDRHSKDVEMSLIDQPPPYSPQ